MNSSVYEEHRAAPLFLQRLNNMTTGMAVIPAVLSVSSLSDGLLCCVCCDLLVSAVLVIHLLLPRRIPGGLRILCYSLSAAFVYVLLSVLTAVLPLSSDFSFSFMWIIPAVSLVRAVPVPEHKGAIRATFSVAAPLCLNNLMILAAGVVNALLAEDTGTMMLGSELTLLLFLSLHPLLGCVMQYAKCDCDRKNVAHPLTMGMVMLLFAPLVSLLFCCAELPLTRALADNTITIVTYNRLCTMGMPVVYIIILCLLYLGAVAVCSVIGGTLTKTAPRYLSPVIFSCSMLGIMYPLHSCHQPLEACLLGLQCGVMYMGFAFLLYAAIPMLWGKHMPAALRGAPALITYSAVLVTALYCLGA